MLTLGIDLGTSGVKAALLADDDRVLATASRPLSVSQPRPGFSEQDPAQWWQAVGESAVTVKRAIEIAEQKQTAQRRARSDFSEPNFSESNFPESDLSEMGFAHPEFRDVLLEVAGDRGYINNMRLGKWLAKNKGRVVGGLRIDPAPGAGPGGTRRWKLSRVPQGDK